MKYSNFRTMNIKTILNTMVKKIRPTPFTHHPRDDANQPHNAAI